MLMFDTNVVIALVGGQPNSMRERFRVAQDQGGTAFAISSVVMFELQFGNAKSQRQKENTDRLRVFLSGTIDVLSFEDEDAAVAGQIRAKLQALGTPIGPYDVMIAGHALRHDATLATANVREFARVDGLKLENWAAPGAP
jgi:tRNA(fMet)-specific endonuclease VapC